ncbi:MAG: hypothetical protein QW728_04290 [Thermoplasmata archaeon]
MAEGHLIPFYSLGKVPWAFSQAVYHALANLNHTCLISVSPSQRYVCIGRHQAAFQVIDLDYCRKENIPVMRRMVGGGAVLLDCEQVFFQAVFSKEIPAGSNLPLNLSYKEELRKKFLGAAVEIHRRLGIDAAAGGANDFVWRGKKISGTGFGEIGNSLVFVGNVILSFDYETMSKCLKVDDEKARGKLYEGIKRNMATLKEIYQTWGYELPGNETLSKSIREAFMAAFSPLFKEFSPSFAGFQVRTELPDFLISQIKKMEDFLLKEEWLFEIDRKIASVPTCAASHTHNTDVENGNENGNENTNEIAKEENAKELSDFLSALFISSASSTKKPAVTHALSTGLNLTRIELGAGKYCLFVKGKAGSSLFNVMVIRDSREIIDLHIWGDFFSFKDSCEIENRLSGLRGCSIGEAKEILPEAAQQIADIVPAVDKHQLAELIAVACCEEG